MNFLSYINHILEMANGYHHALKKEEDEVERIGSEVEVAYGSLEITQRYIQESKLQTYQLQKVLNVPHL